MAVSEVVHANAFHAGTIASGLELIIQIVLGIGKEAVVRFETVALIDILPEADQELSGMAITRLLFGVLGVVMTSSPLIR